MIILFYISSTANFAKVYKKNYQLRGFPSCRPTSDSLTLSFSSPSHSRKLKFASSNKSCNFFESSAALFGAPVISVSFTRRLMP